MKIGRIEQFETKKSYCLEISQRLVVWFDYYPEVSKDYTNQMADLCSIGYHWLIALRRRFL